MSSYLQIEKPKYSKSLYLIEKMGKSLKKRKMKLKLKKKIQKEVDLRKKDLLNWFDLYVYFISGTYEKKISFDFLM